MCMCTKFWGLKIPRKVANNLTMPSIILLPWKFQTFHHWKFKIRPLLLYQSLGFNSMKGNFFQIIHKICDNIKPCVKHNNKTSANFSCQCGVRQGVLLSPLLLAIYLNDLETFLLASGSEGIRLEFNHEDILCYLKLLILWYTDDRVIFSSDKDDFQECMKCFQRILRNVETDY